MDVWSASTHLEKLIKYVETLKSSDTKLYGKTRDQLKEIQSGCISVVQSISEILEDDAICSESVSEKVDLQGALNDLYGRMSNLELLMKGKRDASSVTDRIDSNDGGITIKPNGKKFEPSKHCTTIPASKRKNIISNYRNALSKARMCHTVEATRCRDLIKRWFDVKIFQKDTRVAYNIFKIKDWILDFVIIVGYNIENGTYEDFLNTTYSWLTDRETKYAIPYDVKMCDDNVSLYLNKTAVVLYDMLFDSDYTIMDSLDDEYGVYIKSDMMYNLCKDVKPECLDSYDDYRYIPEVIDSLGLTRIVGQSNNNKEEKKDGEPNC